MTKRFVIVAEDELGRRLAGDLLDRVVAERSEDWLRDLWADEETRSSQRALSGLEPNSAWSTWQDVKRLADQRSIRVHGREMKAERAMARKAVEVAARARSHREPP